MKILKIKHLVPLLVFVLFLLALWSVFRQLHGYHWHEMIAHIHQIPSGQIWFALLLTIASYLVMTTYDFLALKYIRHPLPYRRR